MYRDSLLGVALNCALKEVLDGQPSLVLTEDQRDSIWSVFDETMDSCLNEAPVLSRVEVKQPCALLKPEDKDGEAKEGVAGDDSATAYPVYQCVDGYWCILMKDPIVSVRDEYGAEERIALDYLKVRVNDRFYTEDSRVKAREKAIKRGRQRTQ
ncbi:hypothetical protein AGDE_08718 [Angomonas deanei]|uniref:Uncharacterized protein n=1 Tax=Angomonas deanei TaxID=59799 RepID=S9UEP2_9TRYP|nr:hypothetical protein AGDE_10034 [Angomonas deanei]EPY32387.1 hypothetical protein AGDE_08718 [Angomonas deanei]CAD2214123.1 hypothetical protein, conserved [Angomonas deanei]|eukprot:EPY29282.1 hypothetical protein AGDE_10034 [Angomonas deanei]